MEVQNGSSSQNGYAVVASVGDVSSLSVCRARTNGDRDTPMSKTLVDTMGPRLINGSECSN
eukprot:3797172-Pyramimonas_sp.AAC.1